MNTEISANKKAAHDFHILEKIEAGIELKGTEVKSVREGKINLRDSYARVEDGQCLLYNCDIQPYENASWEQHQPKRPRRLLLHKREIHRLYGSCQIEGKTLVALRAYWKGNRVKIELAIAKGKHQADRREDLKKKAVQREVQREVQSFKRRADR